MFLESMWHSINTHALGGVTFGDISYIPLWFSTAANTPIILFRKSKKKIPGKYVDFYATYIWTFCLEIISNFRLQGHQTLFHYLFIHLLLCAYTCMIWVHECGGIHAMAYVKRSEDNFCDFLLLPRDRRIKCKLPMWDKCLYLISHLANPS